jgi:serine/threonine protein kinase
LLATPDSETDLKIADFGFASKHGDFMKTQLGTPAYIAPEILQEKPYNKAVDMWSIGVISYIVIAGYPPFRDDNLRALFRKIRSGSYAFHIEHWEAVSDEAKDFIRTLLVVDPDKRATAEEALEHSWLKVDNDSLSRRSLDCNLPSFRKYLMKRKFRSAVLTVMAIKKMQNLVRQEMVETETTNSTPSPEGNPSDIVITREAESETRSSTRTTTKSTPYFSFRRGKLP